jgi:hypothetical protein
MQTKIMIAAALMTLSCVQTLAQTTKHAPLAEQKMCDEQAHKRLNEYAAEQNVPKRESFQIGGSHYDPDVATCYFQYSYSEGDSIKYVEHHYQVEDAFEGKGFGGFIQRFEWKPDKFQVIACWVKPVGQPEVKCDNLHDWFGLLEKYFGL